MRPSSETHYDVLGVKGDASHDEIRKAYRRLSLIFHPDRSEGDVEKYQRINEAYEVLSDVSKRMSYDIQLRFSNTSASKAAANATGMYSDIFSELLSGIGGNQSLNMEDVSTLLASLANREGRGAYSNEGTDGDYVLSSLFGALNHILADNCPVRSAVSGSVLRSRSSSSSVSGESTSASEFAVSPDIQMERVIELEQAYNGCSLPLRITRMIISYDDYAPRSVFTENRRTELATIYVDIPKGIDCGEVIRVSGKGHCRYGVYGDVCVKIVLKAHDIYTRDGLNLIYTRSISLTDSLCGFSFDIEHFGKTYTICNNAGNVIPSNHRKVIPQKGMHREGHSGDLIVHFKVIYPKTISLETCNWLRTNLEATAS